MATLSGGKKFEAEMRRLAQGLQAGAVLRVGFLERARYPDGKPVAMIAAIQDFGAPRAGIPPRPFFRNMIAAKKGEWPAAIAGIIANVTRSGGAIDDIARRALDIAGAAIAGQLRQSVIDTNEPPLAPSTIRRKGHAKPLVETGHMLNSIDHEVRAI
jgi:hypothetical protein